MEQHSGASWWGSLRALDARLPHRWLSWADSPGGTTTLASWANGHRALEGWAADELAHPISSSATDTMQAALVDLAQNGSADAGLTLLVQLRPGLVRLSQAARRWDWIMSHDVDDETQATFFEVLFQHRLDRRPRRIAANLLLDTRQKLWRRFPRSGPPTVTIDTASATGRAGDLNHGWVNEVEIWLHLRDGVLELPGTEASRRLTATMAYRAWIEGQPTTSIASELGVAPQTVSTRLYRLRRILRSSW